MTTHVIQMFGYVNKLLDLWLYLDYAVTAMDDPRLKAIVLSRWMDGVPEMVHKYADKDAVSDTVFEEYTARAEKHIRQSYMNKCDESRKTVLNLHLVMMCTVLELFFEHVMTVIFHAQPKTLLSLSSDKSITVKQVIDMGSFESLNEMIIEKTTDRILRGGTKEVIKSFELLGIRKAAIFSWSSFHEDIQQQYASWTETNLYSIFEERHSIVHDNLLPVESIADLRLRRVFFQNIIMNISIESWKKYSTYEVILDPHDDMRKAIAASGGDPSSYRPSPPK